jgi:hypothetical protein
MSAFDVALSGFVTSTLNWQPSPAIAVGVSHTVLSKTISSVKHTFGV